MNIGDLNEQLLLQEIGDTYTRKNFEKIRDFLRNNVQFQTTQDGRIATCETDIASINAEILVMLSRITALEAVRNTNFRRQLVLTGDDVQKGGTSPTDITIGTTPTIGALRFDSITELGSTYQILPFDVDLTKDINLFLVQSLVVPEANGDTVDWTMDYVATIINSPSTGGIAEVNSTVTASTKITNPKGKAIGDIYVTQLVIPAEDRLNPLKNANGLAMEIHLTNTTGVGSIHLIGACLDYAIIP